MSVLGGLANLGAVVQGYQRFEQQDQQIKAARQRNKEQLDDAASIALLGEAFGVSPPQGQPQPPAPGQASQPAAPPPQDQLPQGPPTVQAHDQGAPPMQGPGQAMPGGPPVQAPMSRPAPPQPPAGPPPQAASPQVPPAAAQQQPPRQPVLAPGSMTIESIKERLLANPKTAALIKKDPGLLVRALNKAAPFIDQEGRAKLAEANQQLKQSQQELAVQKQNQAHEDRVREIERKATDAANKASNDLEKAQIINQGRFQIAQLQAQTSRANNENTNSTRRYGVDAHVASLADALAVRKELGEGKNLNDTKKIEGTQWFQQQKAEIARLGLSEKAQEAEMKERIANMQEAGRTARAEVGVAEKGREANQAEEGRDTRNLRGEAGKTAALTEKGREADQRAAIDTQKLQVLAQKAQAGGVTSEQAQYFAKAMDTNPTIVLRMMGAGGAGTAAKQQIAKAFADNHPDDPGALARAEVMLAGNKAAIQTAARQGAKVDIGAKEIKPFGEKVIASAKNLGSTEYSTWNAIRNAIKSRSPGSEKFVALSDAITNYRNALIQVAQRGGMSSEGAQTRADKYVNENMSIPAILAAINSGKAEAEIAQGAVKEVKGDIVKSSGGGGQTKDTPSATTEDDPLGILTK